MHCAILKSQKKERKHTMKTNTVWNFLVEITTEVSDLEGEEFFVQAHDIYEADKIVAYYLEGENYCYGGRFTDEEAEMMGLDTY